MNTNFPKIEEKILKFWQKNKIFEKSIVTRSAEKSYVFYDGPPFATGLPHYGHIVASAMKDVMPRYWTMKGYRVNRVWGWDCHGLPIENLIEKELGLKDKKDIEKIGIEKFNEACQASVLRYTGEWEKFIPRMGRWVDMAKAYKTMDPEYMESIWWVFKSLFDRGLIYEGHKSMHICPRCETTLSNFEVTQGYKEVKDLSVIVKFKLNEGQKINDYTIGKNDYILAWTTTPWTLPGNAALAVKPDEDYVMFFVKESDSPKASPGDVFIIMEGEPRRQIFGNTRVIEDSGFYELDGFEAKVIVKKKVIKGSDLVNFKYEPLFDYFVGADLENMENAYQIVAADFVSTVDGTGVVHVAPAFGEDDMNIGRAKNLPFIQHVSMDGTFKNEVKDFKGEEVKPKGNPKLTDQKITDWLDKKGKLFRAKYFTHSYPHCWRCDTPLLNYSTSSWFVKVTEIKDKMIANNKKIHWVPEHVKDGRFGKWLEGAKDWAISRSRYWGTPLPVWVCDTKLKFQISNLKTVTQNSKKSSQSCGQIKVIGNIEELEKLSGKKITDLHKQFVDKIHLKCEKCGGQMTRIPEVLDCWFESGSMPYAQSHYPFENKEKFEKNFPAEFIAEGLDQTRGWFYTLIVLSTALFDKPAFKNVIVNGIVLAEDGQKMAKRLKNYPAPDAIIEKYGADALRFYLLTAPVMKADDLRFAESGVDEVFKKVIILLNNVFSFYQMYAENNENSKSQVTNSKLPANILDQWIIAKLNVLIQEITREMDRYDLIKSTKPIMEFINELSTWYLRRSRSRFKRDNVDDKADALATLHEVLFTLAKLMAPFTPFIAEEIYQNLKNDSDMESVHLANWPKVNKKVDEDLLNKMTAYRLIVEAGLAARAEAGIKVRQVLDSYMTKPIKKDWQDKALVEIIKEELNIKNLKFGKESKLDIKITPKLKEEGLVRELVRQINLIRKKQGLTINDKASLVYQTESKNIKKVLKSHSDEIMKDTLLLKIDEDEKGDGSYEIKINGEIVEISLMDTNNTNTTN